MARGLIWWIKGPLILWMNSLAVSSQGLKIKRRAQRLNVNY
jgi:hypothetical protein